MHLCAGAVVAASNAALALVQLGDDSAAVREMRQASRRAPGSADLRAALAAVYWSQAWRSGFLPSKELFYLYIAHIKH